MDGRDTTTNETENETEIDIETEQTATGTIDIEMTGDGSPTVMTADVLVPALVKDGRLRPPVQHLQ